MTTDLRRYFGLLILFCAVDAFGFMVGVTHKPADLGRLSLAAALLTILWAIRDGQKDTTP